MKQVILSRGTPGEIIEIVREMRATGMVQGKDFDFKYCPIQYNNDGWEVIAEKHTVFTFYDEKYATWFALKWA